MNDERYSRQALFAQIGRNGQGRIRNGSAVVIGCGALGTVIANNLARSGVGRIRIVDRDFVELDNLQRQVLFDEEDARRRLPKAVAAVRRLKEINSSIVLEPVVCDVNSKNVEELLNGFSVVLDAADNLETLFHLPASLREDLEKFQAETERFKSEAISPAEFRSFRVPQGVYEQREAGEFMLRVRLPAGAVFPHQMRTFASVARKYGNPVLHVTSRQDIQIHNVGLDGLHPALVQLYGAGLSTKGDGGNTVRNITACCNAGVCPPEAFDVTAYSAALTEFLLPDPLSYQLPRNYKIAFSGCPKDCAVKIGTGTIFRLRNPLKGANLQRRQWRKMVPVPIFHNV